MTRNPSARRPFRPCLEPLEGRDVPSFTGLLLFGLTQTVQPQVNTVNADVNQLKADVATQVAAPQLMGPTNSVQAQAPVVNNDLTTLQSDFNRLRDNTLFGGVFFSYAVVSNTLTPDDIFFVVPAFIALQAGNNEINTVPAEVLPVGVQPLSSVPGMTVNAAQQMFGFPILNVG
jgi:hypothetical protein